MVTEPVKMAAMFKSKFAPSPHTPLLCEDLVATASSASPPPLTRSSEWKKQQKKHHGPKCARRRLRRERHRYVNAMFAQLASTASSSLPLSFRESAVPPRMRSFVAAPSTTTTTSSSSTACGSSCALLRELFWAPEFQLEHGDEYAQVLLVSSSASPSSSSSSMSTTRADCALLHDDAFLQAMLNAGSMAAGRLSREQFAFQDASTSSHGDVTAVDDDAADATAVAAAATSFDFGGSNDSFLAMSSTSVELVRLRQQCAAELVTVAAAV